MVIEGIILADAYIPRDRKICWSEIVDDADLDSLGV